MTTTETNTIKCSFCGEVNPNDVAYCNNCKSRINFSGDCKMNDTKSKTTNEKVSSVKAAKTKKLSLFYNASFIVAIITLCAGFYKMFAYDDSYYEPVNVYVNGTGYNYIINANYATAYFTLTILFVVIGFGFLFLQKINELKNK